MNAPLIAIRYDGRKAYFTIGHGMYEGEYRTNRDGEGLWAVKPHAEDRQMTGTAQFSLTGKRSTDHARIVAHFGEGLAF